MPLFEIEISKTIRQTFLVEADNDGLAAHAVLSDNAGVPKLHTLTENGRFFCTMKKQANPNEAWRRWRNGGSGVKECK